MEPSKQGQQLCGAVKKRASKLKPPKNYSSKYGSNIPQIQSSNYQGLFYTLEDKPNKEPCDAPDIVSSCDSKRNSLELDESLGILSPGDMKDFTLSSMTQSFASVTSLPRDVSYDDFDSAADKTVTEESVQSSSTKSKTSRFCLDSTKLEEIEALTGSPPQVSNAENVDTSLFLSDISEISETSEIHETNTGDFTSDNLSEILNQRTEFLLKPRCKKVKAGPNSKTVLNSERKQSVPEKARYCTEAEMKETNPNTYKLLEPNEAWTEKTVSEGEKFDLNLDKRIDLIQNDFNKSSEVESKIVNVTSYINDYELAVGGVIDDENIVNDDKEDYCEDKAFENVTAVINKHLSHVTPHKQMPSAVIHNPKTLGSDWSINKNGNDSMASSLIGKSEGDSISQDTGVFSMPSSMISSNSMALSFAAEMDSSGFFSDMETGRSSVAAFENEDTVNQVSGSCKHQISPITENSEPDSNSSHVSQPGDVNKSSLIFKMSEEANNVTNIIDENETRAETDPCMAGSDNLSITSASSIDASEQISVSDEKANTVDMKQSDTVRYLVSTEPELVLEDLEICVDRRCESRMSGVSTSNSTITPRQKKSSVTRGGSHLSVDTVVRTPRKKSTGPGLATKRAELLQDKPIVPNKNVGSKLKAMLNENEENIKRRTPRVRKPSRWDAVMNKIEEGKQNDKTKSTSRTRSKVYSNMVSRTSSPVPSSDKTKPRHPLRELSSPAPSVDNKRNIKRDKNLKANIDISRCNSVNSVNEPRQSRSNSNISSISTTSQHQSVPNKNTTDQKGISKTNSSGKSTKDPSKTVTTTASNNRTTTNNKNATNTRKSSANEPKPATVKKTIDNKKSTTVSDKATARKESTKKSLKDAPTSAAPKSRKTSAQTSQKQQPTTTATTQPQPPCDGPPEATCQQPDLVKFSVSGAVHAAQHNEIDRLERLVENHVSHVSKLEARHVDNMKSCDVMSILLANMSSKVCLNEKLQSKIDHLSNTVDQANLQISLKDEALKVLQANLEEKSKEFENLIASLKQEHEDKLENVHNENCNAIDKLKKDAQLEIHEMTIKHQEELSELLTKYNDDKKRLEQLHTSSLEDLKNKMSEQEEKLKSSHSEEKAGLMTKISDLTSHVKGLEDNLSNGSDYRVKTAHGKIMNLEQEVESLKTVLEMKTSQVHELRSEKVKLEEKLELYDQQQISLRKMSAQVEDLRSQLTCKSDMEQRLVEDNRVLHQMVMRADTEKKRLSMENEQLSWKMSQSFIGPREFNVLNTPDDSGVSLADCSLSMSYCEASASDTASLPPRFTKGGRPVSAPLTQSWFDDSRASSTGPDSPRVLEIVEKSDSVSWKLEYEAALSSLPPPLPSTSTTPSPAIKRKISPHSPLMLRKCKSSGVTSGLMTQSLDLSLSRSHSYNAGSDHSRDHSPLCRTVSSHALPRSGSVRKKILPSFETLSESTESESDESKKNSPVSDTHHEIVTPAPVDIGGVSDDEVCEISSSSEIEIGVEQDTTPGQYVAGKWFLESPSDSPDTEPEVTIRSSLKKSSGDNTDKDDDIEEPNSPDTEADKTLRSDHPAPTASVGRNMTNSLNSYDLSRLFAGTNHSSGSGHVTRGSQSGGGGEAMIEDGVSLSTSDSDSDMRVMTDSLSTVSWDDINDDQDDNDPDDDESRD